MIEMKNDIKEKDLQWYKKQNINIIPVIPGEKKGSIQWIKYQTQKISSEEVNRFFYRQHQSVGVLTGEISGNLVIIDFDVPELFDAFFPVEKRKGLCIVKSGREGGGYHVYFKTKKPMYSTFNFKDENGNDVVTVKGSGLCVAPPSIHRSGNKYMFVQQPETIPLVDGDFKEQLKRKAAECGLKGTANDSIDMSDILRGVKEGERDISLTMLISYLRRQGTLFEDADEVAQKWNLKNHPPLDSAAISEKSEYHYSTKDAYKYYFQTDPAKFKITADLKLETRTHVEAEIVEDLITENDKGVKKIDIDGLCEYLDTKYSFKGPNDIAELLIYKNGIYVPDTGELDVVLERLFGSLAHMKFKMEIRKHLRDRNRIERAEMNNDPERIVLKNGILNTNTFELEHFSSDHVYTTKLPVTYDSSANAYEFENVIAQILDKGDVQIMQEIFGYCTLSSYEAAKSFWFLGEGGNGKGTLVRVLESMLGIENVSRLSLSQFSSRDNFNIAELYGKLANVSQEPAIRDTMDTNVLKAVTGDDYLQGRIKFMQGHKTFKNTAKLIITANELPQISDESYGFWSRIIAIPFPNMFRDVPGVDIIGLGTKLSTPENLSGILNWALVGLNRLKSNNFRFSSSQTQRAKGLEMMMQTNPVKAFTKYWLEMDPKLSIQVDSLSDAYNLFAHLNEIQPIAKNVISRMLQRDKRLTSKQIRDGYSRSRIMQGCNLSKDLIAAYGWYRDAPLKENGFDSVSDPETEIEIKTCSIVDYCFKYPEPYDEVEVIRDKKRLIFNCEDLVPLYDKQVKAGFKGIEEKHKGAQLKTVSPITPLEEGICEECGKNGFLTHEVTENGKKYLICLLCSKSDEPLTGRELFETTLEERREMLKPKKEK